MTENKQPEQNKRENLMPVLASSLQTGFIGGLFWSFIGFVMYYFNFSEVAPKTFILRSWTVAGWTSGWLGTVVSILMIGAISILTAFIYYSIFKKINSIWMGAVYGIVLWLIVFYVSQPIFTNAPGLTDLNSSTIVSTICLYVLYGTFIGYSISYDYHDMLMKRDNK